MSYLDRGLMAEGISNKKSDGSPMNQQEKIEALCKAHERRNSPKSAITKYGNGKQKMQSARQGPMSKIQFIQHHRDQVSNTIKSKLKQRQKLTKMWNAYKEENKYNEFEGYFKLKAKLPPETATQLQLEFIGFLSGSFIYYQKHDALKSFLTDKLNDETLKVILKNLGHTFASDTTHDALVDSILFTFNEFLSTLKSNEHDANENANCDKEDEVDVDEEDE